MAITTVSDVLVPAIWLPYVIRRTVELSELVKSGIVSADAQFSALLNQGGQTVNMPHWNDLAGSDQVISTSAPLSTKKITSGQDVAVFHNRGDAWATHDLAGLLAGSDPMSAIGDLVANYWVRKMQAQLLSLLKGIFTAASMSSNLLDIAHTTGGAGGSSDANRFTGQTFIDAKQKLGDHKNFLTAIIMHSAVEASLAKRDLIDYVPDSEGKGMIRTFQGLRVIVDDGMPVDTLDSDLAYTSYLFGQGAIAHGVSDFNPPVEGGHGTWQLEFTRDALGNATTMVNRRRFMLHCRGVKWTGNTMAAESPTNAELEIGANHQLVFDQKDIRVVKFRHNIAL